MIKYVHIINYFGKKEIITYGYEDQRVIDDNEKKCLEILENGNMMIF